MHVMVYPENVRQIENLMDSGRKIQAIGYAKAQMKLGDVYLHPWRKNKPQRVSAVIAIQPGRKYFVLAKLNRNGTPSKDKSKWHYMYLSQAHLCTPFTKYPHVYTCPTCRTEGYVFTVTKRLKCKQCGKQYKQGELNE